MLKISKDCATSLDISPTLSLVGRPRRGNDGDVETVDDYFKRKLVKPFLEHMIKELKRRFSEKHKNLFLPSRLICSNIVNLEMEKLEEISAKLHEAYSTDLSPDPKELLAEILRWKQKWQGKELRPSTLLLSLKECNPDYYPNLFTLLKILSILPVSSAECERAFSSLKRLKTYLRSTMGQDRLSFLALINIDYDLLINHEDIVNLYMNEPNHRFW